MCRQENKEPAHQHQSPQESQHAVTTNEDTVNGEELPGAHRPSRESSSHHHRILGRNCRTPATTGELHCFQRPTRRDFHQRLRPGRPSTKLASSSIRKSGTCSGERQRQAIGWAEKSAAVPVVAALLAGSLAPTARRPIPSLQQPPASPANGSSLDLSGSKSSPHPGPGPETKAHSGSVNSGHTSETLCCMHGSMGACDPPGGRYVACSRSACVCLCGCISLKFQSRDAYQYS